MHIYFGIIAALISATSASTIPGWAMRPKWMSEMWAMRVMKFAYNSIVTGSSR